MSIIMRVCSSMSVAAGFGDLLKMSSAGVLNLCGLDWDSVLDDWVVERAGVFWLMVVVVIMSFIMMVVLSFIGVMVVLSIIVVVRFWLIRVSGTGGGVSCEMRLLGVGDFRGVLNWVWCSPGLVLWLIVVAGTGVSMEGLLNGSEVKSFLVLNLGGVNWNTMNGSWSISVD